jgi:hypothetical protein
MRRNRARASFASILLVLSPAVGLTNIKKIKPSANPPQYVAFSKRLPKTEQFHHALDRLTFGPRPGDLERIERIGLKKWLEFQLNPEKIAESPTLEQRLEPPRSLCR